MRYDTAVYFQTLSQGTYDEETGDYKGTLRSHPDRERALPGRPAHDVPKEAVLRCV